MQVPLLNNVFFKHDNTVLTQSVQFSLFQKERIVEINIHYIYIYIYIYIFANFLSILVIDQHLNQYG